MSPRSRIRTAAWFAVVSSSTFVACSGLDLPPGQGAGIVVCDAQPLEGVPVFEAPRWSVGERFEYSRGNDREPWAFEVVAEDVDGYELALHGSSLRLDYTRQLCEVGERVVGDPAATLRKEPFDATYHWPLWVGKRWTCSFVMKRPGAAPLPMLVSYHCDATESVTTPVGTFECLRIWRRARRTDAPDASEQTSISWYAPEARTFVRRLVDDTLWELRPSSGAASAAPRGS